MFSTLKYLSMSVSSISDFCFDRYINPHFRQLERLVCLSLNLSGKNRLDLPHLKVLALHLIQVDIEPIELQLPSLQIFLTNESATSFKFSHPQTLTHLAIKDDHELVGQFINLEFLSCFRYPNALELILPSLPKLKSVRFAGLIATGFIVSFGIMDFNAVNEKAKELNRRSDLEFTGYQVTDNAPPKIKWYYLVFGLLAPQVYSQILRSTRIFGNVDKLTICIT